MFRSYQFRCTTLFLLLATGFSFLAWRLIDIQYFNRKRYQEAARHFHATQTYLPGGRGHILDRNDELIARSVTLAKLRVDRYALENPELAAAALIWDELSIDPAWQTLPEHRQRHRIRPLVKKMLRQEPADLIIQKHLAYAIGHLAPALRLKREELTERIEKNAKSMWFVIERNMEEETFERVQQVIDDHKIQGFSLEKTARRRYASPDLASHVIGYTRVEEIQQGNLVYEKEIGAFGVEKALDAILAGKDGHRTSMTNARGLLISPEPSVIKPPRPGMNIQLTLDMEIQTIIQEELLAGIREHQAPRGCVIVMDPRTGGILGLANYPAFHLNTLEDIDTKGINFATQMVYEPGSTFKIIATAAALNEKLVTPRTPVYCHNGFYRSGKLELKDHHGYGTLSLEQVMAKSSNIGVYKIATQLGMQRFYQYARDFGFGSRTGVALSGEVNGALRPSENPTTFSSMTFGYAVNVTPLQIASAYAAIANGGKLYKPQLLQAVITNDGTPLQRTEPELIREVIKPQAAAQLRQCLKAVVTKDGTALQAAVPGYQVAGKTGTARKFNTERKVYEKNRYTVSFAGMLPADQPAFVCVVVIDDPQTNKVTRYGGTIAAPIFAKAAARIARHMHLTPTEEIPKSIANQ
jgi:cell division protein FtsI/penicillin-binding protein 2